MRALQKEQQEDFLPILKESAQRISESAQHIRINKDRIDDYTAELLIKYQPVESFDEPYHFISGDKSAEAAYILALDSINFGSGYFRLSGQILSYKVVAKALADAFKAGEMNTPERWAAASLDECWDMFLEANDRTPVLEELMQHFASHLNYIGQKIINEYNGAVDNLLDEAQGSAVCLANIIGSWDTFQDVAYYQGHWVPFMKRAQILAADINLAGIQQFDDIEELTCFADNKVPHVLRMDGVLQYSDDFAVKIETKKLIDSGSKEEVELRAGAIWAVELIKESACKQGYNVTSVDIDHILWHRGNEPEMMAHPTHITLSTFY